MSLASRNVFWTVAVFAFLFSWTATAQENSTYKELVTQGVPLTNGKVVKLPLPVMADGLDSAGQQAVINGLVPPGMLAEFLQGSINSYFELRTKDNDVLDSAPNGSIGRRVDLYYVAKGKLSVVASQGFVRQQLEQGKKNNRGNAEFLTDQELKDRKLTVIDNGKLTERYAHAELPLFNRVKVFGTGHGMRTTSPDSVLVAFALDPRFATDNKYPSQWQPGQQDALGNIVWGPPQPYAGAGGYMKVTELKDPPERVFVEYHLAFEEPYGWFEGGNNLIVKLPNQYQADVRKFRENLRDFEKNQQAAGNRQAIGN